MRKAWDPFRNRKKASKIVHVSGGKVTDFQEGSWWHGLLGKQTALSSLSIVPAQFPWDLYKASRKQLVRSVAAKQLVMRTT